VKSLSFWTFTLRHSHTPLAAQIDRLQRSFRELRRRKLWKEKIKGGVAVLEVKVGKDNLWHPHFHVIAEGKYLPVMDVATAWHEITGDSTMIWVNKVRPEEELSGYLTKYLTKPVSHDVYHDPDRLQEAILALKSVRQLITFGTWTKLRLVDPPDDAHEWKPIGRVDQVFLKAAEGDSLSLRYAEALKRKYTGLTLFERPPPDPDPFGTPA
jgi:hypothetical protein